VPHFFLFGPQVSKGVRCWRGFARNLDDDLDAGINQRAGFVAIIREKPDSTEAQVVQDRGRHTEIAAISHEPQCMICFNRIQTAVLQRVSLQFRRQADATALPDIRRSAARGPPQQWLAWPSPTGPDSHTAATRASRP